MKTSASVSRPVLALSAVFSTALVLASSSFGEQPKKKVAPSDRMVITADTPAQQPDPTPIGPARPMTALDATGTPRAANEARMITGSLIKQKFDLYANDANTATHLQIMTQSDLAARSNFGGPNGGVVAPSYSSSMSAMKPVEEHVITRHTLDLRTVPPAQRLETATRLLGEERGRKLVSDFNRWEATHKKRLAAR